MIVNDKSDILSDILRSFHNDIPVRCQESNDLNELAAQHPGKGCQTKPERSNVPSCKKCQNLWLGGKERKLPTSKPVTDTVLVLSNQCISYVNKRYKWSLQHAKMTEMTEMTL